MILKNKILKMNKNELIIIGYAGHSYLIII